MASTSPRETAEPPASALIRVRDLEVQFENEAGTAVTVLQEAGFDLAAGEVLGVLGESGGGKSTLAAALLGLLPPGGRVTQGRVLLRDRDLMRLSEQELARVRGDEISMVFQEPGLSLSPCMRAGDQVADVLRVHRGWSRRRCREEALAVFERVRFDDPARIYRAYPHQLSGGQKQRVVLAQALVCSPALVIADEPTAALDSTTQAEIVTLLQDLRETLGLALLFISHNVALLEALADRVLVVYGGQIVEVGSRDQIYRQPAHPYTRELIRCAPRQADVVSRGSRGPLPVISGAPPDPACWPPGCRFELRCPDRMAICARRRPAMFEIDESHFARCLLHEV